MGIAMKALDLLMISAGYLAASCGGARDTAETARTSLPAATDPRMVQTQHRVEAWLAAGDQRDFDALAAAYAEDAVAESPGPEGWDQAKGRPLVREWAEKQAKWIPDAATRATRVFAAPGLALVEYVFSGTNTGPMWDGGPSTGRKIGLRGCNVLTFDGQGLISRERSYLDTRTMFIQLGKVTARARAFPPVPTSTDFLWVSPEVVPASANWMPAWSSKDTSSYAQLLTDGAVHEDVAEPDDVSGRSASIEELEMFARAVPDMTVTTKSTWAGGSFSIVEYVLSGTQRGEFRGIPASGKRLTIHALDVDESDGTRIVKRTTYSNSAEWREQLGTLPKHRRGSDEPASVTSPEH